MRIERISRRVFLAAMASGSASTGLWLMGCSRPQLAPPTLPEQTPSGSIERPYADSVDALWDVLLPTEYAIDGSVSVAGAREAGVDHVLAGENLLRAGVDLGLVGRLDEAVLALFDDFAGLARAALNAALDAAAALERPLASFAQLGAAQRVEVVRRGFDDAQLAPLLDDARAACWLAFLGAVTNDVGLRAVGFPAFEDFAGGVAVGGYPRLVGGVADDYTWNRAPQASGEDLTAILDDNGDLR